MRPARCALFLLGLGASACALVGYDFDGYTPAPATPSRVTTESQAGASGEGGAALDEGGASSGSAPLAGQEPHIVASTFGLGGEESGASGAAPVGGETNTGPRRLIAETKPCWPRDCALQALDCGQAPSGDTCGGPLDCGACFWWFEVCVENRCQIP